MSKKTETNLNNSEKIDSPIPIFSESPKIDIQKKESIENNKIIDQLEKPSIPKLFPGIEKIGKRSMATETLRNFTSEETLTNNHSLFKGIQLASQNESFKLSINNGFDLTIPGFQFKSGKNHKPLLLAKNGFTLPEKFGELARKFRILDFLLWKFHQLQRQPTLLEINSLLVGQEKKLTFSIEDIKNIISIFSEFCKVRAIFFGNPISNLECNNEPVTPVKPFVSENDKCRLNNRVVSLFQNNQKNETDSSSSKFIVSKKEIIKLEDLMEVQEVSESNGESIPLIFSDKASMKSANFRNKFSKDNITNQNDSLLRIGDDGFIMDYIVTPMVYSSKKDLEIREKIFFNRLAEMAINVHARFLSSLNCSENFTYIQEKSWHCNFDCELIWKELLWKKIQNFENLEKSREFFTFNVENLNQRYQENEEIKCQISTEICILDTNPTHWVDSFSTAIFDQIYAIIENEDKLERIQEEDHDLMSNLQKDISLDSEYDSLSRLNQQDQISNENKLWMLNPSVPLLQNITDQSEFTLKNKIEVPIHSQVVEFQKIVTPSKPHEYDFNQNYFSNSDYKNTMSRISRSSNKIKKPRKKSCYTKDEDDFDFLKTEKKSVSMKWSVSKRSEKQSFLISPLINRSNLLNIKKNFPTLKKPKTKLSSNVEGLLSKIISERVEYIKKPQININKTPKNLHKKDFQKGLALLQSQTIKRKMNSKDLNNKFVNLTKKNIQSVTKDIEPIRENIFELSDKKDSKEKDMSCKIMQKVNLHRKESSKIKNDLYFNQSLTITEFSLSKLIQSTPKKKSNQLHPNSLKREIALYFRKRGFKTVFLNYLINYLQKVFKNSNKDRLQKLLEDFFSKNSLDFKMIDISPEQKLIKPLIPNQHI